VKCDWALFTNIVYIMFKSVAHRTMYILYIAQLG